MSGLEIPRIFLNICQSTSIFTLHCYEERAASMKRRKLNKKCIAIASGGAKNAITACIHLLIESRAAAASGSAHPLDCTRCKQERKATASQIRRPLTQIPHLTWCLFGRNCFFFVCISVDRPCVLAKSQPTTPARWRNEKLRREQEKGETALLPPEAK
jgi:hypothetical protein